MIKNLGKVLTILAKQECGEAFAHADVDAWGAPSECHALVSKGQEKRRRLARKHAEAVAGRPLRIISKEAKRRGRINILSSDQRWENFVVRVYEAQGYPF